MTPSSEIRATRTAALNDFLAANPFARMLNVEVRVAGDELLARLPFDEKLIGNHLIRALHGGAMAAFLELTAGARTFLAADMQRPPKVIDITVDYLRQGLAEDLFATARIVKLGRRIASVHAEAWQADRSKPAAALNAHFLVEKSAGPHSPAT